MEGSSSSRTMPNCNHSRTLTLPRQLHHHPSSPASTAPLLRFPSRSLHASRSSSSCPPSSILDALHEALTDSILPSPPPPARLPSSPSPPHSLSRPPPRLSTLRYTSPPTTSDSPVMLTLPLSQSFAANVSSTRSSLDTLRSIHTSTIPRITTSPTIRRWWFQSDSDAERESVTSVLNDSDLLDGNLGKKFRAPNAPLVFCHGLLGFDSVTIGPAIAPLQVAHWRGIKEVLEAIGCEVLITRVPATSSPVDRAKVLEQKISETYPGRAVHLIGHSMGGIDCRHLITHLTRRTFRVLSLTTIATPHRGSSFASHFLSLASNHLPAVLALLELLPNGGGDGKAFECLTREAMKEFNDNTPDVEGIRYFSWGAEYEPGLIDTWKYPHSIIAAQEGPNDGLVSVQSAQWGTYLGTLRNVNHLDQVGWTGGLAGNLTGLAGLKDMHAFIHGKDIGFSVGRFYGGVADLLAGVEEEEGYVIDGKWVGWQGKEEKMRTMEALAITEEGASDKACSADIITRTASDKERWRMEEVLRATASPSPSRSTLPSPCREERVETQLEVQTRRRAPAAAENEGPQTRNVESLGDTQKAGEECIISQEREDTNLSSVPPIRLQARSRETTCPSFHACETLSHPADAYTQPDLLTINECYNYHYHSSIIP
ncbi:Alpha/Beta hydrolase protein [Boletus reticuloceps]|uniref:Alpha/Beta hydrolase protein n=1 Tax=Boletus reticuloceps TaxID=495285 RepID=A0A8I2YYH0_9AGAM|nr:Alpha/Beta hydrolase protein [Boletus reticuloceps]